MFSFTYTILGQIFEVEVVQEDVVTKEIVETIIGVIMETVVIITYHQEEVTMVVEVTAVDLRIQRIIEIFEVVTIEVIVEILKDPEKIK